MPDATTPGPPGDPRRAQPTTFQDLILVLQQHWAGQGCVLEQPYDMEMGAGTFHPSTFLLSLIHISEPTRPY